VFYSLLQQALTGWCSEKNDLFGIQIEHRSDIYDNNLLAERLKDNRYVLMLKALLEQLLFIDPDFKARLQPGATISLTVARRAYNLDDTPNNRQSLDHFGYRFFPSKTAPGKLAVQGTLDQRDLLSLLQSSLMELGGLTRETAGRNLSTACFRLA
jgi:hypothetical protein